MGTWHAQGMHDSIARSIVGVVSSGNTIVDLDIPIWEGTQTGKSLFLHLPYLGS